MCLVSVREEKNHRGLMCRSPHRTVTIKTRCGHNLKRSTGLKRLLDLDFTKHQQFARRTSDWKTLTNSHASFPRKCSSGISCTVSGTMTACQSLKKRSIARGRPRLILRAKSLISAAATGSVANANVPHSLIGSNHSVGVALFWTIV